MRTKIRPAAPGDTHRLQALFIRSARANPADAELFAVRPDLLDLEKKLGPGDRVLVAEASDYPMGFAILSPAGEVTGLYVDPGAWRRGIGRALVEACESDARGMDAEALSAVANPASEGFWERVGLSRDGEVAVGSATRARFAKRLRPQE